MQGSYKNNGLPRPYYMKPTKRGSAYDRAPRQFFLTNSRKLTGYFVMLVLFGLCMFMVAQELKPKPDSVFEIMDVLEVKSGKNNGDVGKLVDSADKKDKSFEQQVANNKAQNSRGEYGNAVLEAPKGGMVNEGPVVGADEGLVVDGKTKKKALTGVDAERVPNEAAGAKAEGNGVKASRNGQAKKPAPVEPDLLKLNEVNELSDNVKAKQEDEKPAKKEIVKTKKKDKVTALKNDAVGSADDDEIVVELKVEQGVDDRMHKKVDNKLQGDVDQTIQNIGLDSKVKKINVGAQAVQDDEDEPISEKKSTSGKVKAVEEEDVSTLNKKKAASEKAVKDDEDTPDEEKVPSSGKGKAVVKDFDDEN